MARVGIEWINGFPSPCTQNQLSYCDETSIGFQDGMASRGHVRAFNWGNGNAFERDCRDPANGGVDSNWADNVDFILFSSHGGTDDNVFTGCFGWRVDKCRWRSDEARFGNVKIKPIDWAVEGLERETDGLIGKVSVLKAQFGYFELGPLDRQAVLEPAYAFVCVVHNEGINSKHMHEVHAGDKAYGKLLGRRRFPAAAQKNRRG